LGKQSSGPSSRKDKYPVDYDYKWPDKNRMDRRDFAHSPDDTYYGDDSVYDYKDYYENNLNQHEYNRYHDLTYPISVGKQEGPSTREEKVKNKQTKVNKKANYDPRNILSTSSPITLDFKFSNERLKVLKAQEEMFDRIMEYSSNI
jgi:hypothetical protein